MMGVWGRIEALCKAIASVQQYQSDELRQIRQSVTYLQNVVDRLLPGHAKPVFPPIDQPRDPIVWNQPVIAPPMEPLPEPVMWGYVPRADKPHTNFVFTANGKFEYLWMVDGVPYEFTFEATSDTGVHLAGSPHPGLGWPDPSLHRHEVRCQVFGPELLHDHTYPIGGAKITLPLPPGHYRLRVTAIGMTAGTIWQAWFRPDRT